jgi:archaellum component FlaC
MNKKVVNPVVVAQPKEKTPTTLLKNTKNDKSQINVDDKKIPDAILKEKKENEIIVLKIRKNVEIQNNKISELENRIKEILKKQQQLSKGFHPFKNFSLNRSLNKCQTETDKIRNQVSLLNMKLNSKLKYTDVDYLQANDNLKQ